MFYKLVFNIIIVNIWKYLYNTCIGKIWNLSLQPNLLIYLTMLPWYKLPIFYMSLNSVFDNSFIHNTKLNLQLTEKGATNPPGLYFLPSVLLWNFVHFSMITSTSWNFDYLYVCLYVWSLWSVVQLLVNWGCWDPKFSTSVLLSVCIKMCV